MGRVKGGVDCDGVGTADEVLRCLPEVFFGTAICSTGVVVVCARSSDRSGGGEGSRGGVGGREDISEDRGEVLKVGGW